MTAVADADHRQPTRDGAATGAPPGRRPRWWVELALLLGLYAVYSATRNLFGSATVAPDVAYGNALDVIALERSLGLYHEATVQGLFLDWPWFLWLWNVFYGTFHFIVPVVVLVALWRRAPARYLHHRTALVAATLLALVGFSLYPLMPPRLLCDCPAGAGVDHGFVDTLAEHGGLWSFDSGTMQAVSNQYAAMPSLHFGWALWCAVAAAALLRRRWQRVAAFAYPAATLFAIVVTGNHFVLDAVGGALVVAGGWAVAGAVDHVRLRRLARTGAGAAAPTPAPALPEAGVVVTGDDGRYRGR